MKDIFSHFVMIIYFTSNQQVEKHAPMESEETSPAKGSTPCNLGLAESMRVNIKWSHHTEAADTKVECAIDTTLKGCVIRNFKTANHFPAKVSQYLNRSLSIELKSMLDL